MEGQETEIASNEGQLDPPVFPPPEPPDAADDKQQDEIAIDALEQLERDRSAERLRPASYTPEGFDPSYGMSQAAVAELGSVVDAPLRTESRTAAFRTLEDLYSAHPKIGGGDYYLRITRIQPKVWHNMRVAGYLADLDEQITMPDFCRRFGGNTYDVSVRRYGNQRSVASIRLEIPGPPIELGMGGSLPESAKDSPNMNSQVTHPQVEIKRLDIEAQERKRLAEERAEDRRRANQAPYGLPPEALGALQGMVKDRSAEMSQVHDRIVRSLSSENDRLRAQLDKKDATITQLNEQLVHERTTLATQQKEEETRQLREQRERHDSEIRRALQDHQAQLTLIKDEHQRVMNDLTRRANDERENILKSEQMERERIRSDNERREQYARDQAAQQERSLRDTYESRLNEMQRISESRLNDLRSSMDQQMQAVRDTAEREIRSIQSTESVKTTMAERTAESELIMVRGEVERLRSEIETVSRENTELRDRAAPKEPLEAIRDAEELVSKIGRKDSKWQDQMLDMLKEGVGQAGEFARSFMAQRDQQMAMMAPGHPGARVGPPPHQLIAPTLQAPPGLSAPGDLTSTHVEPSPPSQPGGPQRRVPRPPMSPLSRASGRIGAGKPETRTPPPITGRRPPPQAMDPILYEDKEGNQPSGKELSEITMRRAQAMSLSQEHQIAHQRAAQYQAMQAQAAQRQAMQAQAAQQQAMQQQAMQQQAMQQQAMQQQAMQQQAMQAQAMQPQMVQPVMVQPQMVQPVMVQPPVSQPASPAQQTQEQQAAIRHTTAARQAAAVQQAEAVQKTMVNRKEAMQKQSSTSDPETPEIEEPLVEEPPVEITKEHLEDLEKKLEIAISTDVVTPEEFAAKLIDQAGSGVVMQILNRFTADQVVDLIEQGGGEDSEIATHSGRKYLNRIWSEAARLLSGDPVSQPGG